MLARVLDGRLYGAPWPHAMLGQVFGPFQKGSGAFLSGGRGVEASTALADMLVGRIAEAGPLLDRTCSGPSLSPSPPQDPKSEYEPGCFV